MDKQRFKIEDIVDSLASNIRGGARLQHRVKEFLQLLTTCADLYDTYRCTLIVRHRSRHSCVLESGNGARPQKTIYWGVAAERHITKPGHVMKTCTKMCRDGGRCKRTAQTPREEEAYCWQHKQQ